MIDSLLSPFADYQFLRRALLACICTALGAAPLGVLLLQRRLSLMGDALSHAVLPGVALGFALGGLSLLSMTLGGIIAGLLVVALVVLLVQGTDLREDAALAGIYLFALALGVILISRDGTALDLMHILFGSVLAITRETLQLMGTVAAFSLLLLALSYRALLAEAFDALFLRAAGLPVLPIRILMMVLIVCNLVVGFHAMGTLMTVGLMILPALAARHWAQGMAGQMMAAVLVALLASVVGLLMSLYVNVPSGPGIILCCAAGWLLSLLFGRYGGWVWRWVPRRHLEH